MANLDWSTVYLNIAGVCVILVHSAAQHQLGIAHSQKLPPGQQSVETILGIENDKVPPGGSRSMNLEYWKVMHQRPQIEYEKSIHQRPQIEYGKAIHQIPKTVYGKTVHQRPQTKYGKSIHQRPQTKHGKTIHQIPKTVYGKAIHQRSQLEYRKGIHQRIQTEYGKTIHQRPQTIHGKVIYQSPQRVYENVIHQRSQTESPEFQIMGKVNTHPEQIEEVEQVAMKSYTAEELSSVHVPSTIFYDRERSENTTTTESASYKDVDLGTNPRGDTYPCGPDKNCTCTVKHHGLRMNCSLLNLKDFPAVMPNEVMSVDTSYNNITHLSFTSFVNYNFLKELDLSHNRLIEISSHAEYQSKLETLYLSHNFIEDLSNVQFIALTKLKMLCLPFNGIVSIGSAVFEGMKKLEYLDLSRNKIRWIEYQAFDSLSVLKTLKLDHNNQLGYGEQMFPPRLFENLRNLETLWIQGNSNNSSHDSYPNHALAKLSKLRTLFIDGLGGNAEFGPQLTKLSHFEQLVIGFHGKCAIQKLSPTFFQHIPNLKDLELFGCDIQNIDPSALEKLPHLKNYTVAYPKSARCGFCNAFQSLQGLQNSSLQLLAFIGFSGGRTKCLTLSGSYAKYFKNMKLKYLYLNFDDVSVVDGEFLENIPDSIERLHFRGNKFTFGDNRWEHLQKLINLTEIDVREQNINPSNTEDQDSHKSREMLPYFKDLDNLGTFNSPLSVDLRDTYFASKPKNRKISPCLKKAYHCIDKHNRTFLNESETCDPRREICIPPNLSVLRASGFSQLGSVILFDKLSSNKLCYLDFSRGFFTNWGKGQLPKGVETADFSDNLCSALIPEFFPVNNSLKYLCIGNNQLGMVLAKDLNGTIFSNLQDLIYLNIEMNTIYELPPSLFRGLKNLTSLSVAENNLRVLDLNFSSMPALRFVDLSKNSISWITKESRQQLDALVKYHPISINLNANPLPCTCYGIEVLQWLNQTKVTILDKELLECTNEKEGRVRLWPIDKTLLLLKGQCQTFSLLYCILGSVFILLGIVASGLLYKIRWKMIYALHIHLTRRYGYKPIDVKSSQHTYDAFVVYCEEDRAFALDRMIEELESKRGHKLCLEDRDFIPGTINFHNIPCAIQNSTVTLLLLSPDFILSPESRYATQMALLEEYTSERKRDTILLLRYKEIPDKDMTKDLLMLRKKGRALDYPGDEDEATVQRFWDRVSNEIGHTKNTNNRDIMLNAPEIIR